MKDLFMQIIMSIMLCQAHNVTFKMVDENNQPIERVSFQQGENIWYSGEDGTILIDESQINPADSIHLSHLGYKPISTTYAELKKRENYPTIRFQIKEKALNEINITAFNAAKYVENAIKKIPLNYAELYTPDINLDAKISLHKTEDDQRLIYYKGIINISLDKKKKMVTKIPEIEEISPNIGANIFFIKPYQSLSIISIKSHRIIRRYKRFNFHKYEHLEYRGKNAIKIDFKEKSKTLAEGFLIIDTESNAILSIHYSEKNVSPYIIGTMKGKGLVKTHLNELQLDVDYVQQEDSNKFIFDSGSEKFDIKNTWQKKEVGTSSKVSLKRNVNNPEINKKAETGKYKKVEIKKIF